MKKFLKKLKNYAIKNKFFIFKICILLPTLFLCPLHISKAQAKSHHPGLFKYSSAINSRYVKKYSKFKYLKKKLKAFKGDFIGYWKLDDKSGNIAKDSSPLALHDGNVNQNGWTNEIRYCQYDECFSFSHGSSIDVGSYRYPLIMRNLSISTWIYIDDQGSAGNIISNSKNSHKKSDYWSLSTINKGSNIYLKFKVRTRGKLRSVTSQQSNIQGALTPGQWIHIAAVYNGSTMRIYKNGLLIGEKNNRSCQRHTHKDLEEQKPHNGHAYTLT